VQGTNSHPKKKKEKWSKEKKEGENSSPRRGEKRTVQKTVGNPSQNGLKN